MITKEELKGSWRQIKGSIREKFGQITDDDLERAGGNVDQLIGLIEKKTGEARRNIETYLQEMVDNGSSVARQASEVARDFAQHASENLHRGYENAQTAVRQGYDQASHTVRQGYDNASSAVRDQVGQAEVVVRRNPIESVAVVLGTGIVVGAIIGLLMGRSSRA